MTNQPLNPLTLTPLDPATADNWGGTLETVVNNTITEVNDHETRIQGLEAGGGTGGTGGTSGATVTDNGDGTFNLNSGTTTEVSYTKAKVDTLLGGKQAAPTSGTASSSTFLRGDGAWATPASTGGTTNPYVDNGDGTSSLGATGTGVVTTNSQLGTAYTVALGDVGNVVEQNSSNILTVTIPNNTTVAIPVGSAIEFRLYGTGSIVLSPASGVTLLSPAGLRITTQYASAAIIKRSANEWIVSGYTVA